MKVSDFPRAESAVLALACASFLIGAARPSGTVETTQAVCQDTSTKKPAIGNDAVIGIIDFYGLRTVTPQQVRNVLALKEGDPMPQSTAEVSDDVRRLKRIPGVVDARLERVCCDAAGKGMLFVGITEKGAPHFDYRPPPTTAASLPPEMIARYHRFQDAWGEAVRKGDTRDDVSHGHSLVTNPAVRALQEQFLADAASHLETLRHVLRTAADPEQRRIAAWIIGYAPKKRDVVDDLMYALNDPDDVVRNNATRALGAIAVLAQREPEQGIRIQPAPFIAMLNSIVWSDRNKALMVLMYLTQNRSAAVLDSLRKQAVPALVEMARWKSAGHALPAYLVLGRVAGLDENELWKAWNQGERETAIARALAAISAPR
jgi:HEAT repeats